jgi:hypothetical protein
MRKSIEAGALIGGILGPIIYFGLAAYEQQEGSVFGDLLGLPFIIVAGALIGMFVGAIITLFGRIFNRKY